MKVHFEMDEKNTLELLGPILWCKIKSGVWNEYGDLIPCDSKVLEMVKNAPYGATVDLVYDGEPKDDDENLLYAEICMPNTGDMW